MIKLIKKLFIFWVDKESWVSALVELPFWAIFLFSGGYVAFFTSINPADKTIFLVILAIVLFIVCIVIKREIFRKLGKKPPA